MAESPFREVRNMTNGELRAADVRTLNKDDLYQCVQDLLAAEDAYISEIVGLQEENAVLTADAYTGDKFLSAMRDGRREIIKIIFGLEIDVDWPTMIAELQRLKAQDRG